MANLFTNKIVSTDYGDLATLTSLSFVNKTKYNGEVNNGMAYIKEGTTGRGFTINAGDKFDFTYKGTPIYIKTNAEGVILNLAD